tara:strand:+ start:58156 stop:58902 length:747 start_codon:yes stop_codon:yes gene_type:complete
MYPIIDVGFFQVPTFFVVIACLMGLAFFLTTRRSRKLHVDENFSLDLAFVLVVGAVLGARFVHVIFENPEHYIQNPIKVLYFWEGGFVFYGGFVLSFLSGLTFLLIKDKMVYLKIYMQLYTPILSLVYMLGRIGCFLEGCCYGKTCSLIWAVNGRHPTQIYSSLWELGVFIFLLAYESKNELILKKNPERLFYIWMLLHSIGRGLIEFLRDDFRGNAPLVSISTWISLVLFVVTCHYFYKNGRVLKNV